MILPGPDSVTIASEDLEALNQLEALLRSVLSRRDPVRGRDFTVYALKNTGATTVADTLNELFRQSPRITTGDVAVVPDHRLNALVVHAGRTDRERIELLFQALDTEHPPDSLASFQSRIVPVEYADASEVQATLQGIYKAQMTAGGARQSVSIPEGVPSSVASVLRQINAASSSPLLTVEVDETTNSLVLMAPANLLEEVSALITRLDEAAATSAARRLKIIPLKKTRSTHVMELLEKIVD
jgi:type II secretory pathway component GspD/PulD (secretin)